MKVTNHLDDFLVQWFVWRNKNALFISMNELVLQVLVAMYCSHYRGLFAGNSQSDGGILTIAANGEASRFHNPPNVV